MPRQDPSSQLLKGALPMLVLGILADDERYGYEIAQALATRSDGLVAPSEGSLYPTLHRLEADGAVAAVWRESDRGPRRRYYRITETGLRRLVEQRATWDRFAHAVEALAPRPVRTEGAR
jgi:PadR family transcriptional regulator PadR